MGKVLLAFSALALFGMCALGMVLPQMSSAGYFKKPLIPQALPQAVPPKVTHSAVVSGQTAVLTILVKNPNSFKVEGYSLVDLKCAGASHPNIGLASIEANGVSEQKLTFRGIKAAGAAIPYSFALLTTNSEGLPTKILSAGSAGRQP